jgi:hypothetical protein
VATVKPCLDCGTLSSGSRCPAHRLAADNARYAKRGTTAERGLTGAHATVSKRYKSLDLPCSDCGQRGSPQNPITAGHITPRRDGGSNDPGNYKPQCRRCNSRES